MSRDFNGTTDRIDWANIDNLKGDALTISYWVYPDAVAHNSYILCQHQTSDTAYGIVANLPTTESITFVRHRTDAGDFSWSAAVSNITGAWRQVVITSDGGTVTGSVAMYLDGESQSVNLVGSGTEEEHTGSWSIGGRIYDDNRNLDGRIAEIAVWSRVLSADEIAGLADGNTPDSYPTNLLFYYSADTDTTTAETGGAAATVDGTSYSASHPTMQSGVSESEAIGVADTPTLAVSASAISASEAVGVAESKTLAISAAAVNVSEAVGVAESKTIAVQTSAISASEAVDVADTPDVEMSELPALGISITPDSVFLPGIRIYTP